MTDQAGVGGGSPSAASGPSAGAAAGRERRTAGLSSRGERPLDRLAEQPAVG